METHDSAYGARLKIGDLGKTVTIADVLETIDEIFEEALSEPMTDVIESMTGPRGAISARNVSSLHPLILDEVRSALDETLLVLASR